MHASINGRIRGNTEITITLPKQFGLEILMIDKYDS